MKWKTERIMKIITKNRSKCKSLSDREFDKLSGIFVGLIMGEKKWNDRIYLGKEDFKVILGPKTEIIEITFEIQDISSIASVVYLGVDVDNCIYREGFYIGY